MSTKDAVAGAIPTIEGTPPRILIVQAPYYADIVERLRVGAATVIERSGGIAETIDVAGAFELPQAIRLIAGNGKPYDGYVALGCVIRGETSHYDHLCDAAMAGLMQVALDHGLALGTGLLTVEDYEQADARARPEPGDEDDAEGGANKGAEAAIACLGQIAIARRFGPTR